MPLRMTRKKNSWTPPPSPPTNLKLPDLEYSADTRPDATPENQFGSETIMSNNQHPLLAHPIILPSQLPPSHFDADLPTADILQQFALNAQYFSDHQAAGSSYSFSPDGSISASQSPVPFSQFPFFNSYPLDHHQYEQQEQSHMNQPTRMHHQSLGFQDHQHQPLPYLGLPPIVHPSYFFQGMYPPHTHQSHHASIHSSDDGGYFDSTGYLHQQRHHSSHGMSDHSEPSDALGMPPASLFNPSSFLDMTQKPNTSQPPSATTTTFTTTTLAPVKLHPTDSDATESLITSSPPHGHSSRSRSTTKSSPPRSTPYPPPTTRTRRPAAITSTTTTAYLLATSSTSPSPPPAASPSVSSGTTTPGDANTTYNKWCDQEDQLLRAAVHRVTRNNPADAAGKWVRIAQLVPNRTPIQCSARWSGALNTHITRGKWTAEEDALLVAAVQAELRETGCDDADAADLNWQVISRAVYGRTGVQCAARYQEALDPRIRKGKWLEEEDVLLMEGMKRFGKSWVKIAAGIPNRTQRQCRTRWLQVFPKMGEEERKGLEEECGSPIAVNEKLKKKKKKGGVARWVE
ncbi:Myblike DNAbinding domain-containing protein [Podochytrium sp. JEL0797]|nr:Myblike DNAbinding domain-containing protein [Podochytrium sp. JEL0797]